MSFILNTDIAFEILCISNRDFFFSCLFLAEQIPERRVSQEAV